jgi:hypothetical protein
MKQPKKKINQSRKSPLTVSAHSKLLKKPNMNDIPSMNGRVKGLNAVAHRIGKAKAEKGMERKGSCSLM